MKNETGISNPPPVAGDGLTVQRVWPGMLIEIFTYTNTDPYGRFSVYRVERLDRDVWRLHDGIGRYLTVRGDHPAQLLGYFEIAHRD